MNPNISQWQIPHTIVGIIGGIAAAGLVMAMLVPALGPGRLRGWMVWSVIALCIGAVFLGARAVDRWVAKGRRAN